MKIICIFLITFICGRVGYAQSTYLDAIELRKLNPTLDSGFVKFNLSNFAEANKTLGKYVKGNVTPAEIHKVFKGNPFLRAFLNNSLNPLAGIIPNKLISISGKSVTTFADGLTQFLIDRAMEELDVAFFSKFKSFLEDNPEAKILFPTSSDYISNFSPHEYALFIVSLRESFYNDLKNLIYNVDDVFLLPKYIELIDEYPEIIISINCIQLIVDLESGSHPVEVIEKFKNLPTWTDPRLSIDKKPAIKNLYNGLKTSYILANSVRTVETDTLRNWISINEFRTNILEDEIAFRIFLGLIYQQTSQEKIEFTFKRNKEDKSDTVKTLTNYLDENKKNLIVFQSLFLEIIQKGKLVDEAIASIDPEKKPTKEDFYKYINSGIDIIEFGFKVSNLIASNDFSNRYETYLTLARQGNNLYRNVYQKQYSAAILNACSIFELTFEEVKHNQTLDTLAKNPKANIKNINKSFDEKIKVIPDILRYGTFMANVIEAEEPSQVKAAIEAAVLPVGSSTVKKYYRHNFSINAYLGAQFRKPADPVLQSWDASVGFTAPVGFTYTPISMGRKGSFSIFVPLIDVGAIAQFRVSDSTSQIEEDISLGNIFSPGGYLVYGLGWDLPISIGAGGQYGPGLVTLNATNSTVVSPSWRWNIFLAVDIPLFNLSKGIRRK